MTYDLLLDKTIAELLQDVFHSQTDTERSDVSYDEFPRLHTPYIVNGSVLEWARKCCPAVLKLAVLNSSPKIPSTAPSCTELSQSFVRTPSKSIAQPVCMYIALKSLGNLGRSLPSRAS